MRTVRPIVYASVVGLLLACSDSTAPSGSSLVQPPDSPRGDLQVSPATVTLQPGQTSRITATYSAKSALKRTPGHVDWQSSDNNVATVTGGLVRAHSAGQARITAFWGGYQAGALVTVAAPAKKLEDAIPCLKSAPSADRQLMAQC
jgi:hypothetical protein